ncbi:MAG: hypothetical protein ACJARN_001068 [Arenicella sp.]|jgi:hypothetical protein
MYSHLLKTIIQWSIEMKWKSLNIDIEKDHVERDMNLLALL